MPIVSVRMPQLGESIAEGTIVNFLVEVGESVAADQEILEVETQKATMGVTSVCAGTLVEITAALNETYPVGHVLARIEVTDEEIDSTGVRTEETPAQAAEPTDASGGDRPAKPQPAKADHRTGVRPVVEGLPVPASASGASYISPRMRARMQELGLNAADLAGVAGSGAGGRVTVHDLENFLHNLEEKTTSPASPMRVAVADSMRRSWTRPLATVGMPVSLEAVLRHRKATTQPKAGPALYALRALAIALAEKPALGGRLVGRRIVLPENLAIGFAVEVPDGVLVPAIVNAAKTPLADLVEPYRDLVERARQRKLTPEETRPGIATITNFGTFGIDWATPIPLPEQNLVLGLGAARRTPVWSTADEAFKPVWEAETTLSFDHRILDGGAAGRLLGRVGELLQKPEEL